MSEQTAAERSVGEQLQLAVRDLWSMLHESGDGYVVFTDRRRFKTRVERRPDGLYDISWETEDGPWLHHSRPFENPREAAFHAYQGPH